MEFPEILYVEDKYAPSIFVTLEQGTMAAHRVRLRPYGDMVLYAFQTDTDGGPYLWIREEAGEFISCVPPQSLREVLKDIDVLLERE